MSSGLNKVHLIGNTARDVYEGKDGMVMSTLAVGRVYKDQAGEKKETTTFIPLVVFGKSAETFKQYVTKGMRLYIEGRLNIQSIKQSDESYKTYANVVVTNFIFLSNKNEASAPQDVPMLDSIFGTVDYD